MTKNPDFAPPAGSMRPPRNIRKDIDDLSAVRVESELDLHIVRLLELHPDLKVRFRNYDLASLDHGTKMTLLDDMNEVLGVKALKRRDT
ncbi:MAG TPA: hypothetical protein VFS76_10215 [Pyrinomonadaceae bacterium]|nr:hypothetical protein [Pyrinomonadaceae bacterium]